MLTVVPLIIVAVLFYFTVVVQNVVDREPAGNELKIDVTAFQWNWEFSYPGTRNPAGQTVATIGTTAEVPLLVLPTDRPISFTQHSEDVIHSFWIPEFLFKRDVLPDPEKNDQKNVWVIDRIEQPGSFVGRCAEYCGSYHSMMNFEVRALPGDLFDQYMQLRQSVNTDTGQPYSAAEALARMNCGPLCSPTAVTTHPFNPDPTDPAGVHDRDAPPRPLRGARGDEGRVPHLRDPHHLLLRLRAVYGFLSKEAVGIVGLTLTGGLCLIVGTYFRFVARRLEERPEDNPEAEVSDGAGDVGFFSPGSYWPIGLAGGGGAHRLRAGLLPVVADRARGHRPHHHDLRAGVRVPRGPRGPLRLLAPSPTRAPSAPAGGARRRSAAVCRVPW